MFKMILSWIPGWTKEEEKQRTINEIRDGKSVRILETEWTDYNLQENYKGYAKREYPYRILSSLYIFSLVVILGVIAYRTRVVTYRAPFPSGEEKTSKSTMHFYLPFIYTVYAIDE